MFIVISASQAISWQIQTQHSINKNNAINTNTLKKVCPDKKALSHVTLKIGQIKIFV